VNDDTEDSSFLKRYQIGQGSIMAAQSAAPELHNHNFFRRPNRFHFASTLKDIRIAEASNGINEKQSSLSWDEQPRLFHD